MIREISPQKKGLAAMTFMMRELIGKDIFFVQLAKKLYETLYER